jgi:hypothetical protein
VRTRVPFSFANFDYSFANLVLLLVYHVCMCVSVKGFVCMPKCVLLHMYVSIFRSTHRIHIHTCIHTYIYACIHTYSGQLPICRRLLDSMHIHTYINACIHTYSGQLPIYRRLGKSTFRSTHRIQKARR